MRSTPETVEMQKKLREAAKEWNKVHNPWTGERCLELMREMPVGYMICSKGVYRGDGDKELHTDYTSLHKIGEDKWHFLSTSNAFDDTIYNTKVAHHCLDVAVCYCKVDLDKDLRVIIAD